MIVRLIARPSFLGLPEELGTPLPTQLQGPDGQKVAEVAGRVCYDSFGKGRDSTAFAKHLIESGHVNPTYHSVYVFFISGVSRGLSHELVRHHVGVAPSQRSTRYCDESRSPWVRHPVFETLAGVDLQKAWARAEQACRGVYNQTVEELEKKLVKRGADKLTARKQARGAARGILGNALETEMVWSANVGALRHVISQRANPAADAEIRELGVKLLTIMLGELPVYFEDFKLDVSPDGIGLVATRTP